MATARNHFSLWKNIFVILAVLFGLLYALPNLFGEDYAVQISGIRGHLADATLLPQLTDVLTKNHIVIKGSTVTDNSILIRIADSETQLRTRDLLKRQLAENYVVALNLAPQTPAWLRAIGANPLKLGLDLRGGVHFLMEVDLNTAVTRRLNSYNIDIQAELRQAHIRYRGITTIDDGLRIRFKDMDELNKGRVALQRYLPEFTLITQQAPTADENNLPWLILTLQNSTLQSIRDYAVEQTITTLRNRVNELGVAEALVQRQGVNRIVVELPGIQDTARAKEIIGKTATIELRLATDRIETIGDATSAPAGFTYIPLRDGMHQLLVSNDIIITGDVIVSANADVDSETGQPMVSVRLGGDNAAINKFATVTKENVHKLMATIYAETRSQEQEVAGKLQTVHTIAREVINNATIAQPLYNNFRISPMRSMQEARDLALLLRAGALPVPIDFVAESTVGPSLGQDNIQAGIHSVIGGLALVLIFMALYYSVFGIIADLALLMNLVILLAICSAINVTLTLPGIAGIVLTLGMAVDANVLIFERIREELRQGATVQAAIHAGYEKAFVTIVDANVSTLLAAIVLFSVVTGPVKGFAVVLIIGLLTSMFTATAGSRALVNWLYGSKKLTKLPIGI